MFILSFNISGIHGQKKEKHPTNDSQASLICSEITEQNWKEKYTFGPKMDFHYHASFMGLHPK